MRGRLLRFPELKERGIFPNRMAEWRARQRGGPIPYELGPNSLGWDEGEINDYVANLPRRAPKKAALNLGARDSP